MKTIKLTPIVYQIRIYDKGSYEDKSPYSAICLLQMVGDKEGYISGYMGEVSLKLIREIRKEVKKLGLSSISIERKGKVTKWQI